MSIHNLAHPLGTSFLRSMTITSELIPGGNQARMVCLWLATFCAPKRRVVVSSRLPQFAILSYRISTLSSLHQFSLSKSCAVQERLQKVRAPFIVYCIHLQLPVSIDWTLRVTANQIIPACGCGPLSLAALEGNFEKLDHLLNDYPNTLEEVNIFGQTPLHLATGLSSCLSRRLLRGPGIALLDTPDYNGHRPIQYALLACSFLHTQTQHINSLRALLDHDCRVGQELFDYSPTSEAFCESCAHMVRLHMKDRRERLQRLALETLPRLDIASLDLSSSFVLDAKASMVIKKLNERGVTVPESLQVGYHRGRSMYHYGDDRFFRSEFNFRLLYDLGFRDLDRPNTTGNTPLSDWCGRPYTSLSMDRCHWLVAHGADLSRWEPIPQGTATVAHSLYASIGGRITQRGYTWRKVGSWHSEQSQIHDLTSCLLWRHERDTCHCSCSPAGGGCSAFTCFLRASIPAQRSHRYKKSKIEMARDFLEIFAAAHTSMGLDQAMAAVRFLTFQSLGIRHTCRHRGVGFRWDSEYDWMTRTAEEIDELHQEDAHLLELLEALMVEFEMEVRRIQREQYVTKKVSFWTGYWAQRMEQVGKFLDCNDLDQKDKSSAESVGVIWDDRVSETTEDCDEEGEDDAYHESDWDSDVDDEAMFRRFSTLDDLRSRLDLIVSKGLAR